MAGAGLERVLGDTTQVYMQGSDSIDTLLLLAFAEKKRKSCKHLVFGALRSFVEFACAKVYTCCSLAAWPEELREADAGVRLGICRQIVSLLEQPLHLRICVFMASEVAE